MRTRLLLTMAIVFTLFHVGCNNQRSGPFADRFASLKDESEPEARVIEILGEPSDTVTTAYGFTVHLWMSGGRHYGVGFYDHKNGLKMAFEDSDSFQKYREILRKAKTREEATTELMRSSVRFRH